MVLEERRGPDPHHLVPFMKAGYSWFFLQAMPVS